MKVCQDYSLVNFQTDINPPKFIHRKGSYCSLCNFNYKY